MEGVRSTSALDFFEENLRTHYVQELERPAYEEDAKEIELKPNTKLEVVCQEFVKFFEKSISRHDEKRRNSCTLTPLTYSDKPSGFRFADSEKGLTCDIGFVFY